MSDAPESKPLLEIQRLPTAVPGLDDLLHGGIPTKRATIIAGRSGTGKTILGLQLASSLAARGINTVLFCIEELAQDLIQVGDLLSFGTRDLVASGPLSIEELAQPSGGRLLISGSFDVTGLISRLLAMVEGAHAEVVIIDSISALFSPLPGEIATRHLFTQLVRAMLAQDITLVMTIESSEDYGRLGMLGIEDHVCDLVLVLRNLVDGKRRRRTVEVHKYRRSAHLKGEYPAALTSDGLSIFPLDATAISPPEDADHTNIRYASGCDGLDAICDGGFMRDNIVLLRGPAGGGKTILSGMYAVAGAERGERVFYYGFEETRGMLLRNYDRLNIPMRRHIDAGLIQLIAHFPEATSPEDMIIELRAVLNHHQPSLIILDSISAIEHITSYESFRQFIVGITSALRQHGRSALLTQSVDLHDLGSSAPYLSTLADAIIVLNHDIHDHRMHRYLRVMKMRGSRHSLDSHAVEIGDGGLHVDTAPRTAGRSDH